MKNIDFGKYTFVDYTNLNKEELKLILLERNKKAVRQWMNNRNIISWEEHLRFIKTLDLSKEKRYWLVKRINKPVGALSIVDIDLAKNEGVWGYYLFEQFQGTGWGVDVEFFALDVFFNHLKLDKIKGYVHKTNTNSLAIQPVFNFIKTGEQNNQFILTLNKENYDCLPKDLMEFKINKLLNNGKT